MPTICSITGAELPKNKIDGINVLDALKNNNMADLDDRFFYYHKGEKLYGVRQGKWKYLAPSTYNEILLPGEDGKHGVSTWQKDFPEALFNLDSDVRELNNRLSEYPEIASILKNQLLLFQEELDNESRPIGEIDRE